MSEKKAFAMPSISKEDILRLATANWAPIALVLFAALFVYPTWGAAHSVAAQAHALGMDVTTTQSRLGRLPVTRSENGSLREKFAQFESQIFEESELPNLIGVLSTFAKSAHVTILKSRPLAYSGKGPEGFDPAYRGHRLELTVEGGYHQTHEFLKQIESYPKHVRVESLEIQHQEDSATFSKGHVVNLVVVAFARRGSAS